MTATIPSNRPTLLGDELANVGAALQNASWSGDGAFSQKCSALLEQALGVPRVFLTPSCTQALELAALLLELQPGDEVIVPSFTFTSTVNAFVLRGAQPVFVDVRPDTLNLDERLVAGALTPRTRAIVVMHYAGVACEMAALGEIARRHHLALIEDNAHGLFGRYQERYLGTFGSLATQSFHDTKNFTCGEGGALLVNDPGLIERAEIIREKGTDRGRFFRGQVDKYTWVDLGSSFLLADLLAAVLHSQLERRAEIQARRRDLWRFYFDALQGWAAARGVQLPVVPAGCEPAYHLFHLLVPAASQRQPLLAHLRSRGVQATFHYLPLHSSQMGRRFGYAPEACPVSVSVSERLVRLPLYHRLTDEEAQRVVDAVLDAPGP